MRLFFLFSILFLMASCMKPQGKAIDTATENLNLSLENSSDVEILDISSPDSAYGADYFTPSELKHIYKVTQSSTRKAIRLMNNTKSLTDLRPQALAAVERQMKASSDLPALFLRRGKKGKFSGYKLCITYRAKDERGFPYKSERWYFTDRDGKQILRSLDIPLL